MLLRDARRSTDWLIPDGEGIRYPESILERKDIEWFAGLGTSKVIISPPSGEYFSEKGGTAIFIRTVS